MPQSKLKFMAAIGVIGILVIVVLANQNVVSPPSLNSTGISFKACVYDANNNPLVCNDSRVATFSVTGSGVPDHIGIASPTGTFSTKGTVQSWSFQCSGVVTSTSGGSGFYSPITATASGTGAQIAGWPIAFSQTTWTLSQVFGTGYGQKNIAMALGSKSNPCILSVQFQGLPKPMPTYYRYSVLANWTVNYRAPTTTSTTATVTTSTVTTTSTVANTVTTSSTDIWNTTVSSASGGQTGTSNNLGVLVTAQQDSVTPGQTLFWSYLPPNFLENNNAACLGSPDGSKGCFFLYVYQPGFSWTFGPVFIFDGWNQWVFPNGELTAPMLVGADGLVPRDLGTDRSVTLYNLELTQTYGKQPSNLPPPPYDQQYLSWKSSLPSSCFMGTADGTAVYAPSSCTTTTTTTTTTSSSSSLCTNNNYFLTPCTDKYLNPIQSIVSVQF